ncbi:3'(2'),5'-bisphosphate nucleotidase CysQ [Rossellomorea sp. KS-H15a]|uniref:3'(2'),5'-bisphosphate nucleotidase CysQ n=1 Tax=Rossellomorea sp. KS-H15a TaxID=2963940 RepID=UPI0020C675B7|nr:3'(2'),5'-bisphosphate nucleotidase CysQ [Rossellomorea sp. KS-H15a]UTE75477.1 3'(2'),5'-bisphosphate nucleotidase CysQ [Rossellomorea sp. KS-H15a]
MLNEVIEIAIGAGKKVLEVYDDAYAIHEKEDRSPLTIADQLSHEHIKTELSNLFPTIPILSEEGASIPFKERKNWSSFWLVDPLDGTKEFIKKNGEFTVNIALIQENRPVLGIVYAPALDILYYAKENDGAFKQIEASKHTMSPMRLYVDRCSIQKIAVVSRSHMSKETEVLLKDLEQKEGRLEFISIGSSLKFCLLAEGAAHYYPRLAPTMEWDTGAGHCIAVESGCQIVDYQRSEPLTYNKENLLNPWFICSV